MAAVGCKKLRVLFADDEKPLRELMRLELPRIGHEVTVCEDGHAALAAAEKSGYDVAILDIRMPGLTGIEVLKRLRELSPDTEVVLLTGHATVETAIESLRYGAFDYLTKPCKMTELEVVLHRAFEKRELQNRNLALETRLRAAEGPTRLMGTSKPMRKIQEMIAKVAPTDSTVLILGETGTGKEVVARSLHEQSKRASMPFVPLNCGALPEHLVESELFGHRKGAFTGADQNRKGLFEVANGGTLFLDEVGELPKALQSKLLRFLESGEIRRIGENEPFRVDVRVLCATNRDLHEMVTADQFREDLYFRVNTFEVRLPALRERREDIPMLAEHLLQRIAKSRDSKRRLTPTALELLSAYDWPGNVRELANVIEYASILAGDQPIVGEHLPAHVKGSPTSSIVALPTDKPITLHELEMQYIIQVLERNNGNKPETARQLGISLKTLYNKLNAHNDANNSLAG